MDIHIYICNVYIYIYMEYQELYMQCFLSQPTKFHSLYNLCLVEVIQKIWLAFDSNHWTIKFMKLGDKKSGN